MTGLRLVEFAGRLIRIRHQWERNPDDPAGAAGVLPRRDGANHRSGCTARRITGYSTSIISHYGYRNLQKRRIHHHEPSRSFFWGFFCSLLGRNEGDKVSCLGSYRQGCFPVTPRIGTLRQCHIRPHKSRDQKGVPPLPGVDNKARLLGRPRTGPGSFPVWTTAGSMNVCRFHANFPPALAVFLSQTFRSAVHQRAVTTSHRSRRPVL